MRLANIEIAVEEAQRFLAKVQPVRLRAAADAKFYDRPVGETVDGCAETAALKRASLDLTRALANLRKPD